MKNALNTLILSSILLFSCGKSPRHSVDNQDSLKTAHQALYNQTMDMHDEVMPKMDNLYTLKKSLRDSIAKTPGLSAGAIALLENRIHLIDSASNAMMMWMRQFNPPDTVESQAYGEYIEKELEKVKQVKALMLEALK